MPTMLLLWLMLLIGFVAGAWWRGGFAEAERRAMQEALMQAIETGDRERQLRSIETTHDARRAAPRETSHV